MSGGQLDWAAQRVLVTGATGFIGRALAEHLAGLGVAVHGCGRDVPADAEAGPIAWHAGDLEHLEQARAVVGAARPTVVFHLAGAVTGGQALDAVLPTLRGNLLSTVNLMVASVEAGNPRFVTAGSLVEPDRRERDAVPSSPYAAAKWASGDYARLFHALYGLPATVARIFMVYGPGQRDRSKLVPYSILAALRGDAPRCASGERRVDWIYVDDVVTGLMAIAETADTSGATIDLGTGTLTPIRSVVEEVVRQVGSGVVPRFGERADPRLEPVVAADVDRTRERTGWRAGTGLNEGLAETIRWYREHL